MSEDLEKRVAELELKVDLIFQWLTMSSDLQCEIVAKLAGSDHPGVAVMRKHMEKLKAEVSG